MSLTTDQVFLLNNQMGKAASDVRLGDKLQSAFSVSPAEIALASGHLLVGNGSALATDVALSGDATLANTGALTIATGAVSAAKLASDAVTTVKILDGNVTKAKLAAGVQLAYMVVLAGKTAMSGTSQDITASGALAGDICFVQINTADSNNRTILTAITATDKVTVTFSGAAGTGGNVSWQVLRATS